MSDASKTLEDTLVAELMRFALLTAIEPGADNSCTYSATVSQDIINNLPEDKRVACLKNLKIRARTIVQAHFPNSPK